MRVYKYKPFLATPFSGGNVQNVKVTLYIYIYLPTSFKYYLCAFV